MINVREDIPHTPALVGVMESPGAVHPAIWDGGWMMFPIPLTFGQLNLEEGYSEDSIEGLPPVDALPHISDPAKRSMFFTNVAHLLSGFNFQPDSTALDTEKTVAHRGMRGNADIQYRTEPFAGYWTSHIGVTHDASQDTSYLNSVGESALTELTYPSTLDWLQIFKERVDAGLIDEWHGTYHIVMKQFIYRARVDGYEICWGIYNTNEVNPQSAAIFGRVLITLNRTQAMEKGIVFNVGDKFIVSSLLSCYYPPWSTSGPVKPYSYWADDAALRVKFYDGDLPSEWTPQHHGITNHDVAVCARPRPTVREITGVYPGQRLLTSVGGKSLSHRSFCRYTDDLLGDAFAAAGYSANTALSNAIASFDINMIENSEGLSSAFGVVDILAIIRDVRSKSISGCTLKDVVDVLANARLVKAYVLDPTFSDVKTIVKGARAFQHRWLSGGDFSEQSLYGKQRFYLGPELVGDFGGNTYVDVRVKMVGKFHPDCLLYRLLPADAIGVLPKVSNLWACMPFSFVVDNVLNVSNALGAVEGQLTRFIVFETSYSVVSATFVWEPNLQEIFGSNAQVRQSDMQYRSYYRMPLAVAPVVGPSRIASTLFTPHMPDDLLTYAALTYQVLLK